MLPSGNRMRRREEFTSAVRRGDRAGRPRLVLHLQHRDDADEPVRVGFTVGRPVGDAVTRNKVRRRLRHIVRERLYRLPAGSLLVVRANPKAATARNDELAADVDAALDRLLRREVKRRR
ncbi:ribonuclease P protein component [Actinoallomurus oryzae]|jgi:ribonuclease P protein component|uniref:Ribonuclease P protein component n=1 Tax=Actinoallomurus oryzae TaxID=502180 RepID=A0ABP8QYG6_9ACTN|nr:ribonuclease P protein component [Actinoallomurus sp. NBC_01490]